MNAPTIFCATCAALLLTTATVSLPAAPRPTPATTAAVPAAHPTFTVQVVDKGRPLLLIPGLTCPGAVWNETVAHYQQQYQCHIISLAGFGGAAPVPPTQDFLPQVRDQLLPYILMLRNSQ